MTKKAADKLAEHLYWAIPFNREKQDLKRLFVTGVSAFLRELAVEWRRT